MKKIILIGVCILTLLFVYSYFIEPYWIEINKIKVNCGIGKEIKIVQLSDLHIKKFDKKIVKIVCRLKPDYIVFTGDMVDDKKYLAEFEKFVKEITECGKVFAVFGNWEYASGTYKEVERIYKKYNVTLLKDSFVDLKYFILYGIDTFSFNFSIPKFKKPVIVITHFPIIAKKAAKFNVCLALAGHTHGGQICLPFIGPLYLPKYSDNLVYGLYRFNNTYIYISKGLGTYKYFPFRFNCRPEITLIILT